MKTRLPRLRIGVLTNDDSVPSWAFKMLEAIQSSEHCEVVLHVINNSKTKSKAGLFSRIWTKRKHLLLYAYQAIDARLFSTRPDAFKARKLTELWGDVRKLRVVPIEGKYTDRIADEDLVKIKEQQPDVLIRLGFRILTGEILTVAPQGIWSYHHADNRVNRGGPAGFWEFFLNEGATGITLQKLTEALDDGVVLDRSSTSTNRFSYSRNRNALYWRSALLMSRKLNELAIVGATEFWINVAKHQSSLSAYSAPLYKAPANWQFLALLFKKASKVMRERIYLFFNLRQWILLYRFGANPPFLSFFSFKRILPPKDRIWADPFVIDKDGKTYVFLEEQSFKSQIGHISVLELSKKGWTEPKVVIKQPYHMSFPFLFENDSKLYMIPETGKNNCIEYYECTNFPYKWEKKGTLMNDVVAMDSVLLEKDGTWYLFTSILTPQGASSWDELHLFHSDAPLTTDWQPHPMSPIVTDVRKARMAGDFFKKNGELFRPSQNCSDHYGASITLNRVLTLSRTKYEEVEVDSSTADWASDLYSTHTLNSSKSVTLIDAQIHRSKL